jgi:hypothetical protein
MTATEEETAQAAPGRRRVVVCGVGGALAATGAGVGVWRLVAGGRDGRDRGRGGLYVTGFGGVLALDSSNGGKKWQALSGLDSQSRPVFSGGTLCVSGVQTAGRTVVNGLDTGTDRVLWEREFAAVAVKSNETFMEL